MIEYLGRIMIKIMISIGNNNWIIWFIEFSNVINSYLLWIFFIFLFEIF